MKDLYREEIFIQNHSGENMHVALEPLDRHYPLNSGQEMRIEITYDLPQIPGSSQFHAVQEKGGIRYYIAGSRHQNEHLVGFVVWVNGEQVDQWM
ncbi:hypothetical protein [Deinococcus misasensis]|uniref:hypothetical protein n=1 Tax=Deinococcus misasensis TaxID=392413 RepID=UPI000559974F|nr:hypothetical protein [Deinococcus misasensis]